MPTDDASKIDDDFQVYRSSPLPSGIQPLVLISWRSYAIHGDDTLNIWSFIVTEGKVMQAKTAMVTRRYARYSDGRNVPPAEILAVVKDRALMSLEALALHEHAATPQASGFFQPVTLTEVGTTDFALFVTREPWRPRWKEIREMAEYSPLRYYLEESSRSPLAKIQLDDLKA